MRVSPKEVQSWRVYMGTPRYKQPASSGILTYIFLTLVHAAHCLFHDVVAELGFLKTVSKLSPLLESEGVVLDEGGVRLELESLLSGLDWLIEILHTCALVVFSNERLILFNKAQPTQ